MAINNGHEKAAIFLSSIGEEAAAEILKHLDMRDIGEISVRMSKSKTVSTSDLDMVLKEASEKISKGIVQVGGGEYVKNVLSKGLGEENANKILEIASKKGTLESLKWVDPKTLSSFLLTEHPQTIALILCLLEPLQSAEVMASFPEALKSDVAIRIASTETISESAIEELEEVLRGQLDVGGKSKGRKLGGVKAVAEILNQCDRTTEQAILEKIDGQNSTLADSIRQLMFVFDDVINIDDKGIQAILKDVTTEELSLALKTASEALKEKIFKNMSQRAAQILKEEMETRGPAKVSDIEKAQQNIVKVARKLEEEGKLVLPGKGGEELVA
ncbi:MAG: flagellar motor switch protein FliG [Nitrospirae bacterium]|nr:flagellar motor switch protein FliG [Nitrospirota bacterium]